MQISQHVLYIRLHIIYPIYGPRLLPLIFAAHQLADVYTHTWATFLPHLIPNLRLADNITLTLNVCVHAPLYCLKYKFGNIFLFVNIFLIMLNLA